MGQHMWKPIMVSTLAIIGLVLIVIQPVNAVERHVPSQYQTIQEAVFASKAHGDVIIVSPGTYTEEIRFYYNFDITIRSVNPDDPAKVETTIIVAPSGNSVMNSRGSYGFYHAFNFVHTNYEHKNTLISGFTITGGGIDCDKSAPVITKNVIRDCKTYGIMGGAPTITQNVIRNNEKGGVAYCSGAISYNSITNNSGSGLSCCSGPISHNTITGNSVFSLYASGDGGGGLQSCSGIISYNFISGNIVKSEDGSGYFYESYGGGLNRCDGTICNNIISGNLAISHLGCSYGGGLALCNGTITNNTITGNCAVSYKISQNGYPEELSWSGYGGGLYNCDNAICKNNIIAFNWAKADPETTCDDHESFNFIGDPLFISTGGWSKYNPSNTDNDIWVDGVYHLQAQSPCINAGDNTAITGFATDIEGNSRIIGGIVDMGAYEQMPPIYYTLVINVVGKGTVANVNGSYQSGDIVNLTATPDSGYLVKSWQGTDNDLSTANINHVTVNSDKVVMVEFEPVQPTYTLSTSVFGELKGAIIPMNGIYQEGTVVKVTAVPSPGYRIKSWYGTKNDSVPEATKEIVIDSNKTIKVEFEQAEFAYLMGYFASRGNQAGIYWFNFITGEQKLIEYINTNNYNLDYLVFCPKDRYLLGVGGYSFYKFKIDSIPSNQFITSNKASCVIGLDFNSDGDLYTLIRKYDHPFGYNPFSLDFQALIKIDTKTWSYLNYHRLSLPQLGAHAPFAIRNDDYAICANDVYGLIEINLHSGAITNLGLLTGILPNGTTILLDKIFWALDYDENGLLYGWDMGKILWRIDPETLYAVALSAKAEGASGAVSNAYGFTLIDETFAPKHSLSVTVNGGHGSVTPTTGSFAFGSVINLTAVPDFGYQIKTWTGSNHDSSKQNKNTITLYSNKTVQVQFEKIPLSLSTQVVSGLGTLNPQGGTQFYGTVVTLNATPKLGYRVKKWTGTDDDTSRNNSNTVTMISNKTVTVEFELITYVLTVNIVGNGIVPIGSGTYQPGEIVTINAQPALRHRVKAWQGTNDDTSKANTNTVTMDSDQAVTVEFEKIPAAVMSIKGGKAKPTSGVWGTGTFTLAGLLPDCPSDLNNVETIDFHFGPFQQSIPVNQFNLVGTTYKYQGNTGKISALALNLNKQTFILKAKKVNLGGLCNPVVVELDLGDYWTQAEYNIKNLSMKFLQGYADSVRVDSVKVTPTSLKAQGALAVQNTALDFSQYPMIVTWGNQEFIIPVGGFNKKDSSYRYKDAKGINGKVYVASIDMAKCTFSVIIRKADIEQTSGIVVFGIKFSEFNQTYDCSVP